MTIGSFYLIIRLKREVYISSIIIDGYNLIGIYHKDLEKQRNQLIESLIKYRKKKGHNITVVFDGWKTGELQENRSIIGGIKVIYSKLGEKADSVIKRIISREKGLWIVVTSDRDIVAYAWSSGSVPISSEEFLKAINKSQTDEDITYDKVEENYLKPERKGNPKKLSKKERAIRHILNKL